MTEQTTFNEAPASVSIKAYAPNGFDVMLTIRDDQTTELLPRTLAALDWLASSGFTPTRQNAMNTTNGTSVTAAPVCPTHGTPMQDSKFGGYYCAERVADDDGTGKPIYCKQKVK